MPAAQDANAVHTPFYTAGTLEAQPQEPDVGKLRVYDEAQAVHAPVKSEQVVQFLGQLVQTPPEFLYWLLAHLQFPLLKVKVVLQVLQTPVYAVQL